MLHIKLAFWGLLAALVSLWLLADPMLAGPFAFLPWRAGLINGTGVLGIAVMSVALMLATRPVRVETELGGLDKVYRLHKWLGITGLVMATSHWAATQAPQWGTALGWFTRPPRGPREVPEGAVLQLLQDQRGLAEGLGEWTFYAVVVLLVLALVKAFPYRYFFKTHRLLAVAYLVLVLHALLLVPPAWWGQLIAAPLALLLVGGSVAAVQLLAGRVGLDRRAVAVVEDIDHHPDSHVLALGVRLQSRWAGHEAGQFAFVRFQGTEGPHPFTITSAWQDDGRLRFMIKGLGDYTRALPGLVKRGDLVRLEGPYGRFDFSGDKPRQIWVGGGIGITPFIARLQALTAHPKGQAIDLYYTTTLLDAAGVARLRADAAAARVTLHVLVDSQDGLLSAARIRHEVPDWQAGDIWFCGPAGFGQALRRDFCAQGLANGAFHQELFEMR